MLNQDQISDSWGRIKDFISDRAAEITHEEKWGTRRLAYPIRKGSHQFLEGSYHLTRFSTEKPFNIELQTLLRLDEHVLRSLVVVAPAPGTEPEPTSPLVRPAQIETPPVEAPAAADQEADEIAVAEEPVAEAETVEEEPAVVEEAVAEAETAEAEEETAEAEEPVAEAETAEEEEETAEAEEPAAEAETVEEEEQTPEHQESDEEQAGVPEDNENSEQDRS